FHPIRRIFVVHSAEVCMGRSFFTCAWSFFALVILWGANTRVVAQSPQLTLKAPCTPWLFPVAQLREESKKVTQHKSHRDSQVPLSVYSIGDPTDEEQQILEFINRARANPPAEGMRLDTTTDPDVSFAYQYWKTPTRAQVLADFQTYPARPPF